MSLNRWGHLGYICIALGMFLLAKQIVWGWLVRFLGEAIWMYIGIKMKMSSVYIWSFIFLGMELYGFFSWLKI